MTKTMIRPITPNDYAQWLPLWEGYNTFYKRTIPLDVTQTSWNRFLNPQEPMFALVAEKEGQILGLVHYLFHRNTAMVEDVCYLQDLFTVESARGQGVGRALIEAVYLRAKEAGSSRVYWQTHETNVVAKKLYDKIADYSGFVVYRKQI
ncbi:N-acetyltransferase family protein [Bdellovibrio bacteriovorus]|uniref:GNAT family N-acetyltransferase n=1 Tax=Bdellovibrio bacteriovorus TaxID=959 RepID=UPI0035A9787C